LVFPLDFSFLVPFLPTNQKKNNNNNNNNNNIIKLGGTGASLVGTDCICDTGYLCEDTTENYWGCAAESSCACGAGSTPCTSFVRFPPSQYPTYYSGKYHCIDARDTSISSGGYTYTATTCNVPERMIVSSVTYNSACATPCKSWTRTDFDYYDDDYGFNSSTCSGSCYDLNDQCMSPSVSPTASPTEDGASEALNAG